MLIKAKDTNKFENEDTCVAYEYLFKDKDLNIAFIEINGRYPKEGRVTNEVVKENIEGSLEQLTQEE